MFREIKEKIEERKDKNFDHVGKLSDLVIDNWQAGTFHLPAGSVCFGNHAWSQFIEKLGIPEKYLNKCPEDLYIANMSYWKEHHGDKDILFRLRGRGDEGPIRIRALLSDQYNTIDDHEVFLPFVNSLNENNIYSFSFKQEESIHQINGIQNSTLDIFYIDCKITVNHLEYRSGIRVTNSEIGNSAVWIEPIIRNQHGDIFASRRNSVDRIIHRGDFYPSILPERIKNCREIAQIGLTQLAETLLEQIPKYEAMKILDNKLINKRIKKIIEELYQEEEMLAKAQVGLKILELTKDLPIFKKHEIQQMVGTHIGLFKNYKNRFAEIVKQINNQEE